MLKRRFTYANVAATLALFFSMSGGALAASHYLISSTKQISPKVLKSLKGHTGPQGLTGAIGTTGATGAAGATGKEGPQGKEGKEGPQGTALAYAHVSFEGVIEAANSKNAGTVEHPGEGVYCFSHLSFTPHDVQATVDYNEGGGEPGITATLGVGSGSGCPAGTQITVGTLEAGGLSDRAFFLTIN
jgi:hypothetical protein